MFSVSRLELKHRARKGDKLAKKVYPLRAKGHQLVVMLLILQTMFNAGIAITISRSITGIVAVFVSAAFITICTQVIARAYLHHFGLSLAGLLAPGLQWMLKLTTPLTLPLGNFLNRTVGLDDRMTIYSRDELFKIFEHHERSGSDVDKEELAIVKNALSFGSKFAFDVMIPVAKVTKLDANDVLSPVLLGELHDSGYSRFPVFEKKKPVGVMSLKDAVASRSSKLVRDVTNMQAVKVSYKSSLKGMLDLFYEANTQMFFIVDDSDTVVGILTVEDLIGQLLP